MSDVRCLGSSCRFGRSRLHAGAADTSDGGQEGCWRGVLRGAALPRTVAQQAPHPVACTPAALQTQCSRNTGADAESPPGPRELGVVVDSSDAAASQRSYGLEALLPFPPAANTRYTARLDTSNTTTCRRPPRFDGTDRDAGGGVLTPAAFAGGRPASASGNGGAGLLESLQLQPTPAIAILRFAVSDDGPGIPAPQLSALFKTFSQAQPIPWHCSRRATASASRSSASSPIRRRHCGRVQRGRPRQHFLVRDPVLRAAAAACRRPRSAAGARNGNAYTSVTSSWRCAAPAAVVGQERGLR
jgi:hypothetical protein